MPRPQGRVRLDAKDVGLALCGINQYVCKRIKFEFPLEEHNDYSLFLYPAVRQRRPIKHHVSKHDDCKASAMEAIWSLQPACKELQRYGDVDFYDDDDENDHAVEYINVAAKTNIGPHLFYDAEVGSNA